VTARQAQTSQSSDDADLGRMLAKARRSGLFQSLDRVYGRFPQTTCDNCARCCFESPGLFFVEYLRLAGLVAKMPRNRRDALLRRAFQELLFSWIQPERQCLFLESGRCTIYESRPLACRLFGLVSPADRDRAEAEARLAARQEARRLGVFGIEVPEAVVTRSLVSCDRVRDAAGRPVRVDHDALAAEVAHLDEKLISREAVVREFCFRSLPERLGAAALGVEALDLLRVQMLRRAQRGEPIPDLLALVWRQARLPAALRGRGGARR
jgi:Fe-S-cluster containining protein